MSSEPPQLLLYKLYICKVIRYNSQIIGIYLPPKLTANVPTLIEFSSMQKLNINYEFDSLYMISDNEDSNIFYIKSDKYVF